MKKLIGPILIGLVMFGAAFGGAFYLYRQQQAAAATHMKDVVAQNVAALNQQGRVPVFSGRFVALMPGRAGTEPGEGMHPALLVPGTVRYEIDLKALRAQDVVWDEQARTLSIRLPSLLLGDPGLDATGIRQIAEGGAWIAPVDGAGVLDAAARDAARAELLKQARAGDAMNLARDAARALVERSFAAALHAEGGKADIDVHFADEDREERDETAEDPVPAVPPPAPDNAMDHQEGGNESAAKVEG